MDDVRLLLVRFDSTLLWLPGGFIVSETISRKCSSSSQCGGAENRIINVLEILWRKLISTKDEFSDCNLQKRFPTLFNGLH